MTPTIPSQLARDTLHTISREANRPNEAGSQWVRQLEAACAIASSALERCYLYATDMLEQGMEGRTLAFVYKELADTLEQGSQVYRTVLERIRASAVPAEQRNQGIQRIGEYSARCEAWLAEIKDMVDWIESARPHVEPARLPKDNGEQHAKGFVGLNTFIEGLKSRR